MSNWHYEKFQKNIERVNNFINIFIEIKQSSHRPTIKEADVLRAAVVFLHSAFEDYLRGVLIDLIPLRSEEKTLEKIALVGTEKRAEKFSLGSLLPYKDKTVADLIKESVESQMKQTSFNDSKDIGNWLNKISINFSEFHEFDKIDHMIQRRHKIVHEADNNPNNGRGYHAATSIRVQTVEAWRDAVLSLVSIIDRQIDGLS